MQRMAVECDGRPYFPQSYLTERMPQKDEVHSYGCFMLAFVEAYKNGIYEVEIEGITK